MVAAVSKVGGWDYEIDTEDKLTCPACGGEQIHLAHVRVNQGGGVVDISDRGPACATSRPSGRGTAIGVDVWCEDCPATHTLALQFHKGVTYMGMCRGPDRPDETKGDELWRD